MASRSIWSGAAVELGQQGFHARQSFTVQVFSNPSSDAGEDDLPPATFWPFEGLVTPSEDKAAFVVAEELTDNWIRRNAYTMTKANAKSAVLKLYNFKSPHQHH